MSQMEERVWRETEKGLKSTLVADESLSLQTLSSLRSFIINPSTSNSTISAIFKTLTHCLSSNPHHHIFPLLSDLSLHHPHLSPSLSNSILSLSSSLLSDSTSSSNLAAASLSVLLSISSVDSLDDGLLTSLCFRPSVSVRVWFLNNALRFRARANLLLTVLLGFTKDPYPCVRQAALDGLASICQSGVEVEDCRIIEGCYFRSVELLGDREDSVRIAAIRAVSEWGQMLAASKQEGDKRDWYDAIFLQICSMVRDMNVRARVEALSALGKVAFVSEDILLQSLSKKILGIVKEKKPIAPYSAIPYEIHASMAAGAFIHGLEDEYSEVQRAACVSLRMLTVLSHQFAGEAVNLLSYVLNDDSMIVRLEALKAIHYMAKSGFLKMQEAHIDMLRGTLVDSSPQIRTRAIYILGSVKLLDLQLSKLIVQSLLESLDIYPQSEAEIFRCLFSIGQNHSNYAISIIEDFYHEINPSGDWKIDFDKPRVAGLLVLAISASLKDDNYFQRTPPRIFSYAAVFFGRISHAFDDVLEKDSLLAYLSNCGDWSCDGETESGAQPEPLPAAKSQEVASVHVLNSVNFILANLKSLWQLAKSGCTSEVLKALRCCKESMETMSVNMHEYAGVVAFAFQYMSIMRLIVKIWDHFVVNREPLRLSQTGELDFLLGKLDKSLLALRFSFTGLSEEDELYVLELLLLSYVLRLSWLPICCKTSHKLSSTVTHLNLLRNSKSISCSEFVNQLSLLRLPSNPLELRKLREIFIFKDFALDQNIRHIKAELIVLGFDSISPLKFFSGLPVGIPCEITLYNVTSEHRLWLKLALDEELIEFVFLDMEEYGGDEELRRFRFTSSFYRTPKAVAFTLRVSIGMECLSENLRLVKGHGGPKHALTYLCPDIEVYFANTES